MVIQPIYKQGSMQIIAARLSPGMDVRSAIESIAQREQISAGSIVSAVGSLSQVQLRFANADVPTELAGKHEILLEGRHALWTPCFFS